ncbi:hypothetical protein GIB67_028049 [Kingdonia uniflora]|uniref:Uncharacterized protein n=1 Tax=Kingdonia uniflora TaxID=39325 RepID=A0A7J7L1A8_9MAGN|nr:hypothetical protein GIB67_028049 [Kingdonia uniflora]
MLQAAAEWNSKLMVELRCSSIQFCVPNFQRQNKFQCSNIDQSHWFSGAPQPQQIFKVEHWK